MNLLLRTLALALAASLLMLGGCKDKHNPVKPTAAAAVALH